MASMLHPLNVSEMLTSNVYLDLYSQILIMTQDGSLVSYSYPADIISLRDQAAVVAMVWQENVQTAKRSTHGSVKAITIEDHSYNTIARAMQDGNLLVLTGRGTAATEGDFKITIEKFQDVDFYGTDQGAIPEEDSASRPLKMQRLKVEAILKTLEGIVERPSQT